jgi:hypothetical protein
MGMTARLRGLACGLLLVVCPMAEAQSQPKVQRLTRPPDPSLSLPQLPILSAVNFRVERKTLWVSSSLGDASLGERASSIDGIKLGKGSVTLAYQDDVSCELDKTVSYSEGEIQARIENSRAYRLYKDGAFIDAARGFHRAMALAPHFAVARTNHIAALCRGKDRVTARLAFAKAIAIDPIRSYEKLLSDEDFAPLRPEFRKHSNAKPLLYLSGKKLKAFDVAHAPSIQQIAVVRQESSWGSENWMAELHIFDGRSGKLVSLHPIVQWGDTQEDGRLAPGSRGILESRLERLSEALSAFGFRSDPGSHKAEFEQLSPERSARKATIKQWNVSLVADRDVIRMVRGDAVLATFPSSLKGAEPLFAFPLPEAQRIVYFGRYMVAEGCDSGPGTRIEAFAVPATISTSPAGPAKG